MVDGMENDLPARDTELSPIGHDGGEFGGQVGIRGGFEPLPVTLPEFGPGLDDEFEGAVTCPRKTQPVRIGDLTSRH